MYPHMQNIPSKNAHKLSFLRQRKMTEYMKKKIQTGMESQDTN